MKAKFFSAIAALALVGFVSANPAYAQDKNTTDQAQHEGHHPDSGTPAAKDSGMDKGGMMGNMDMESMKGMMHECMEMHKDGKMCDHDMMDKCQKQMGKGDCQKMMKQAKKEEKSKKK